VSKYKYGPRKFNIFATAYIYIYIIKEKYIFIRYLLTSRLKSTCSYFKASSKLIHNKKITHILNMAIPNRKYNINISAVDKLQYI